MGIQKGGFEWKKCVIENDNTGGTVLLILRRTRLEGTRSSMRSIRNSFPVQAIPGISALHQPVEALGMVCAVRVVEQ